MPRQATDPRRATVEELSKAVLLARDMGANEIELRGEKMTLVMRNGARKGPFLITHFAMRSGHVVYFVRAGNFVKIGTTSNLDQRLASMLTDNPVEVEVLLIVPGSKEQEKTFHARFKEFHHRREWFRLDGELAEWIEKERSK
jgi:hypothetical protein